MSKFWNSRELVFHLACFRFIFHSQWILKVNCRVNILSAMLMWPPCGNQREGVLRASGSFSTELFSVTKSQRIRTESWLRGDQDEYLSEDRETEPQTIGMAHSLISHRARTWASIGVFSDSPTARWSLPPLNFHDPLAEYDTPCYLGASTFQHTVTHFLSIWSRLTFQSKQ